MEKQSIILDTDIGTNVDDLLALKIILSNEHFQLLGVTTVFGDSQRRAQMVSKVLAYFGQEKIPVHAGLSETLLRDRITLSKDRPIIDLPNFLTREDFTKGVENSHAVDFIIDSILKKPNQITIVAIGPLSNIALAIIKQPEIISKIKKLIIMGGVLPSFSEKMELPIQEHNLSSDPEAAYVVFNSGISLEMHGLNVGYKTYFTTKILEKIKSFSDPFLDMFHYLATEWMHLKNRDVLFLCDPLTILSMVDNNIFTYEKMDIQFIRDPFTGEITGSSHPDGKVSVAIDVQTDKAVEKIYTSLISN